jgi:hypothetical protein
MGSSARSDSLFIPIEEMKMAENAGKDNLERPGGMEVGAS